MLLIFILSKKQQLAINNITWNRFNKPQSVQKGNKKYYYAYSPLGYKLIEKAAKYSNYYVYDATGNVQAQYRISGDSVFLSHHVLYGAKRLGLVANSFFIATKPNRAVFGPENLTITSIPLSRFNHRRPLGRYYTLELGNKQYELSNHLGNVQAVISDRKLPVLKNGFIAKYQADLQSSKEYYPFGMVLYDSSLVSYNYGFNGKPHDFGISSWQDYGFRFYDTRFPRFLSVDPLAGKYPSMAPYVPFANNPILFVDPDGRDWEDANGKKIKDSEMKNIKVYIFYDPRPNGDHGGFPEQTVKQYSMFEKQFGKGSVALSPSKTELEFYTDWSSMVGSPEIIAINMHGSNQAIHIDSDNDEYIVSTGTGKTNRLEKNGFDVKNLPKPKANIENAMLQLNTCHSGDPFQYELKGDKTTLEQAFHNSFNFRTIRHSWLFGVSYDKDGNARPQYYMPWKYHNNTKYNQDNNEPHEDQNNYDERNKF